MRETLHKEYGLKMTKLEDEFKPRLQCVRKQMLQMERDVPSLNRLLADDSESEEL